jgi:ribonuclease-3
MKEFPEGDEGLLTQKRSTLVQKEFLASMGKLLDLLSYLKIESPVNLDIEKIANKQQANLYESLIGALYLDGGLQPCKELILSTIWTHRIEAWKSTNYKGRLIEYCHSSSLRAPKFQYQTKTFENFHFCKKCNGLKKPFPVGLGINII